MATKKKKDVDQAGSERLDRRCYDLRKRGHTFTKIEKQLRMPDRNGNGAWERVLRAEKHWGPLPAEVSILRKRNATMNVVVGDPPWARRTKPLKSKPRTRSSCQSESRAGAPESAELSPEPALKPALIEDEIIEKAAYRKLKALLVQALVEVDRKIGA